MTARRQIPCTSNSSRFHWLHEPQGITYDTVPAVQRTRATSGYLAIGVTCQGTKEILGLWIEQTEGAKFWMRVMTELKGRGVTDILVAVVDGLKGFPEAITAVFPDTVVQTCMVHLIRYSMQFASWKERKAIAKALRPVYGAVSAEAAAAALDEFEEGVWGQKYPPIVASWRRKWGKRPATPLLPGRWCRSRMAAHLLR